MTPDEFADLKRKVQTLEHQHAAILSKLEKVLRRLEDLERVKPAE